MVEKFMSKILVVDDENQVVELLEKRLTSESFTVFTAGDGKSALREAQKRSPDLILLDIRMVKMDGFEVLRRLKEDPKTRNIPVIMLTGRDEPEAIEQGIRNYADKYITKPYNSDYLVTEIKKSLALR